MKKYRSSVYQAVQDYYKENFNQLITETEIDDMSRKEVLRYWLEWEGIIGYTNDILDILGVE